MVAKVANKHTKYFSQKLQKSLETGKSVYRLLDNNEQIPVGGFNMSLVRYNNPWNVLNTLQRELYDPTFGRDSSDSSASTANWAPSVDISENDKEFTLLADIPGVDPEDIDISMEKGVLTIKGERSSENIDEGENYRRVERQSGQFYRRFTLPDSADADKIEAKSEHGVLTITIPKQEVAVSRRIEVKH